jgi:hypothetical protein
MKRLLKTFVLLCILTFSISSCSRNPYQEKQNALANDLKVDISDYVLPSYFPYGYFQKMITPGMNIIDVHKIIVNYEAVFACGRSMEVYYYFDDDDDKALRFIVYYDKQLNFKMMQRDDSNSRYISVEGCIKGQKLH